MFLLFLLSFVAVVILVLSPLFTLCGPPHTAVCRAGCEACSAPGTCTQCKANASPNGDGTCSCNAGFFEGAGGVCEACPANCVECISGTQCLTCIADHYGPTCSVLCDSSNCVSGFGQCDFAGVCQCSVSCQNGGVQNSDCTCDCSSTEWSGDECNIPGVLPLGSSSLAFVSAWIFFFVA